MKALEIKKVLEEEFVGKPYNQYELYKVGSAIRALLPAEISESRGYSYDYNRSTLTIKLFSYSLITVEVKKEKGKRHYNYGYSYCDWSYKGFGVLVHRYGEGFDPDVEETAKLVIEAKTKAEEQKNKHFNDLARSAKIMKEALGDKGFYEFCRDCKEIYDNMYDSKFKEIVEAKN